MCNPIASAFGSVIKDATPCASYYVVLWRIVPFYGGPQEGGWWGEDRIPESYKEYSTMDAARQACDQVIETARQLGKEARRAHAEKCGRELDYCEARGIDDANSVFGEVNGADRYWVTVETELPEKRFGEREWS